MKLSLTVGGLVLAMGWFAAAQEPAAAPVKKRPTYSLRPRSTLVPQLDEAKRQMYQSPELHQPESLNLPSESYEPNATLEQKREAVERLGRKLKVIRDQVEEVMRQHPQDTDKAVQALLSMRNSTGLGLVIAAPVQAEIDLKPGDNVFEQVRVLGYVSKSGGYRSSARNFCGPLIEFRPGQFVGIVVLNLLPETKDPKFPMDEAYQDPLFTDPASQTAPSGSGILPKNPAHGYSTINLHTHGLHVSPNWPADDIFKGIGPGEFRCFIYEIPTTQPPGTYFYHSHNHGATAVQLAQGMAGALFVRDSHKGLDKLQLAKGWSEETILVQQIALMEDKIKGDHGKSVYRLRPDLFYLKDVLAAPDFCNPTTGDIQVAKYMPCQGSLILKENDKIGLSTYSFVNGQFLPKRTLKSNVATRLRVIHAGIEANLRLWVEWVPSGNAAAPVLAENLPTAQFLAWDGIVLADSTFNDAPVTSNVAGGFADLAPGNRADVLLIPPTTPLRTDGEYRLVSNYTGDPKDRQELLILNYADTGAVSANQAVVAADATSAEFAKCRPEVPGNLPAATALQFQMKDPEAPTAMSPNPNAVAAGGFTIRDNAFEMNHVQDYDQFELGKSHQWEFSTEGWATGDDPAPHPFHVHVNSFYVTNRPTLDFHFPSQPFWSDTFLIEPGNTGATATVSTQFQNWFGDSVYHCHILDHEDAGMMHRIRIRPAGGQPRPIDFNALLDSGRKVPLVSSLPGLKCVCAGTNRELSDPTRKTLIIVLKGPGCLACAENLQALLKERMTGVLKNVNFRLVVVSATEMPRDSIDAAHGWKPEDMVLFDSKQELFQRLYCVDDLPENGINNDNRQFKHLSDEHLLHAAFVIGTGGEIVAGHRGVHPYDDFELLMGELK